VLVACASASALDQFLCAYTAIALSEFFVIVLALPIFLMLDGLSKQGFFQAEKFIYYCLVFDKEKHLFGEMFFVQACLLERSSSSVALGGGSCSTLPVIETLLSDVSAYISSNVISITDGQIFLSQHLFLSCVFPAIDVTLSVTRVGSIAQWDRMKLSGGFYKLELSQFIELQSFSQF